MNHPNRKRDLFDCSPAIAAKLARCNEIARVQLEKTKADAMRYGIAWITENRLDCAILEGRSRGEFPYPYFYNLNA